MVNLLRHSWRTGLAHVLMILALLVAAAQLGACAMGKPQRETGYSAPRSVPGSPKTPASSSSERATSPRTGSPPLGAESPSSLSARPGSTASVPAASARDGTKPTGNRQLCAQVQVVGEGTPVPTLPPPPAGLVPVPPKPTHRGAYLVGACFRLAFVMLAAMLIYNVIRRK